MYKQARNKAGLTIEEASYRIHVAPRTLSKYEAGDITPSPETVVAMSRIYNAPALSMLYCRRNCAIGEQYCYDLLNNVDLSMPRILTKYRQEDCEALEATGQLAELLLNKQGAADCTDEELLQVWRWALELLDLEHVIETMKLRLWDFVNVGDLIAEHNKKCEVKNYYDPDRADSILAG